MNIQHKESENKGSFFIEVDGKILAEMTYSRAGEKLFIIDHTEVNDALRGKSAGKQMVEAAVKFARENEQKIIPICPFAKSIFERVKEFQDVLKS